MTEFEKLDKDHEKFVAGLKALPIETQLLMFCIREEDLLVPPEVYLAKLYEEPSYAVNAELAAMRKPTITAQK